MSSIADYENINYPITFLWWSNIFDTLSIQTSAPITIQSKDMN